MSATVGLYLDKRREAKDGKYPVRISVTHNRKTKYYTTGIGFTETQFKTLENRKVKADIKHLATIIYAKIADYENKISDLNPFTFEDFERVIGLDPSISRRGKTQVNLNLKNEEDDIIKWFDKVKKELDELEQVKTSEGYGHARDLFIRFFKQKTISFKAVTPHQLRKMEHWMLNNNVSAKKKPYSISSVGIYMRYTRHIFKLALNEKLITEDEYPFGKDKYIIPTGKGRKIALKQREITLIAEYQPVSKQEQKAKDFWMISLLANGANMKDILSWTWDNITENKLTWIREKTKRSRKEPEEITVFITATLHELIERWAKPRSARNPYIFECLDKTLSAKENIDKLTGFTKQVNKYMGRICKKVGIHKNVTTYAARHSFATWLNQSGFDIKSISISLGHASIRTTQAYLNTVDDEDKLKVSIGITNMLKKPSAKPIIAAASS